MKKNEIKLTPPSGGYWDHLRKLGLQNFIISIETNKIVAIKGKEERKIKGKGKRTQVYFHLQDGRVYHSSKFKQIENLVDTQKPLALVERIILASSDPGDLVADFYAGSHTTGEVSLKNGSGYIGCDINPRSLEIGSKRLEKY